MAKDNFRTKFYKFIYKLDKESNKEEGKETPDFDTWLKNIEKKENNNLKKPKNKMAFGKAMSYLADDPKKSHKKSYQKTYKGIEREDRKLAYYDKLKKEKLRENSKKISKKIENNFSDDEKIKLNKNELKKAIIYSEIIGKPKAKR
ncbi:hypothetical protein [Anaerococcus rubeinfantis]|uniref:hypothetical protein n=1 Tax=Anaerococcus rubeinfantis TaxID=1720199 RepID=UPI00073FA61E|nr:hypothetical protein [Anaerococcus rubeinfantis]